MPRPGVGNPGNRGGGRKSAFQEQTNARILWQAFFRKRTKQEFKRKLAHRYSLWDVLLTKAFGGDLKALIAIFNKLFPDNLKTEHSGSLQVSVISYGKDDPINAEAAKE